MTARPLAGGHVRVGAWSAIEVDVANDGPAISGELRLASDQPPRRRTPHWSTCRPARASATCSTPSLRSSGATSAVTLVSDGRDDRDGRRCPITTHDPYQSVIGVVAEEPGPLVSRPQRRPGDPRVAAPAIVSLTPADLPARVEAWSAIDRLVWQDVDTAQLEPEQLAALRTWLGLGGRLVILGGSTGATTLGSLPDDLLPFRPTGTVDASPAEVEALDRRHGRSSTRSVPALGGTLIEGTVLGRSGDSVIAAERTIGQGRTTIIGIDPTARWHRRHAGGPGPLAASDAARRIGRSSTP